jgi:arsenite methyltransferase
MKILILCTGNSCRSQMAHGWLQSFDKSLDVHSAGTEPASRVNSKAVKVMAEAGIDISNHFPKSVNQYLDQEWDYVITVCGGANESCPVFSGKVKHRIHIGFDDPSHATGTDEFIWSEFHRVRDEIKQQFYDFYLQNLKDSPDTTKDAKEIVKEKYSQIALQSETSEDSSCCSSGCCCSSTDFSTFSDSYEALKGYTPEADLGLGCGLPTEFAQIKEGDTVVDLGSGAGNDCFVARALVGESGKVIGIDMTDAMIEKAKVNAKKRNYNNIEFHLGDIENIPLDENEADVVISNCVLNLVPDKQKAFSEIFRILKPGGHLSVSDVVLEGELPENIKQANEMYAGCVSGAVQKDKYLRIMSDSGLTNIIIQKEKVIAVPDEILLNYLSQQELDEYKNSDKGIFSITVYAQKPANCSCKCDC